MKTLSPEARQILTHVVPQLALARDLSETTQIVAEAARQLCGSDGTTFVLRERDKCYYADENAIAPLWKGKRFDLEACISGWSMLNKQVAVIKDIYVDGRIPHDAYRPTFVKSLCTIPVRLQDLIAAIGCYWSREYEPTEAEVKALQILADSASMALENLELKQAVKLYSHESLDLKDRADHLELAMYSMAHDLRSPISIMTGLGELLRMQTDGSKDKELTEHIKSIIETGRRTAGQIDRMLSLYRATSGKVSKQEVDVTDLSERIIQDFRSVLRNRKVVFKVAPKMTAFGDPSLLYLVLENLLSNAVKYTSKKSVAEIEVGHQNGQESETYFVRDNGIGFLQSQVGDLFKPLSRLHIAKKEYAGTGLGLASVSHIISLHGGQVRAEGKEAEGATFYFSLPRQMANVTQRLSVPR